MTGSIEHVLRLGRRRLGHSTIRGHNASYYGTTAECSCGWKYRINEAPSKGGNATAKHAHRVHLDEVCAV